MYCMQRRLQVKHQHGGRFYTFIPSASLRICQHPPKYCTQRGTATVPCSGSSRGAGRAGDGLLRVPAARGVGANVLCALLAAWRGRAACRSACPPCTSAASPGGARAAPLAQVRPHPQHLHVKTPNLWAVLFSLLPPPWITVPVGKRPGDAASLAPTRARCRCWDVFPLERLLGSFSIFIRAVLYFLLSPLKPGALV